MTQEEALTILKTGANVFLTGEPGAGKTHTINRYVEYLRSRGVEPAITASTGIAATHIGGMTIHSWSGIGVRSYLSDFDLEDIASKERLVKRMGETRVLIIDEISMLSGKMLSMVDQVCRAIKRSDHAFGGLQVILVGDFFQLPPIVDRSEQRFVPELFQDTPQTHFAFDSSVWSRLNLIVCYLQEQHRQEDKTFLSILSAMRNEEIHEDHVETLKGRQIDSATREALKVPKLYTHNADVDRINSDELSRLGGEVRSFAMESKGPDRLIESLKRSCLSPDVLGLKVGAKVMFTKNDFETGFVNGTLGEIEGFNKDDGYPIVRTFNGDAIVAMPMEWPMNDGDKVLARIKQVPLRLAWALTVHKSQGMSLDAAFMDLSNAFEYGQGYVALSRVRSLNGLYLGGLNERALRVHPTVRARDSAFKEQSSEAQITFDEMEKEKLSKLHMNFLSAIGASSKPIKKIEKTKKKVGAVDENGETYNDRLERLRKVHPKAYMPWIEGEDERLTDRFEDGLSISELSAIFERKPGAITARLKKLGLIEE